MAIGKPLVAFDLTEARVSAGEAAVYATPNDPDDFARKTLELLDDPARRQGMGLIGRTRFETKLAWEHQRQSLLSLYRDLLGEPAGAAVARSAVAEHPGGQSPPIAPSVLSQPKATPAPFTPLRLLFVNHNVVRGGGTFYRAFDAARYLVRRGHSVTLLSIASRARWRVTREVSEGVEIFHTPDLFWGMGRSGWDPWDTLVRTKLATARRFDLVHAWDCRPAVIFPALAARYLSGNGNTKLVIDWCDWWGRGGTQVERGGHWSRPFYDAVETFFEESFRRFGDGTTVISSALYDRATELGVRQETIRLLPQGCDAPVSDSPSARMQARTALGLDIHDSIFISVGVLNTTDASLLYDTMRLVLARLAGAKFVLIGKNRAKLPDDLQDGVREEGFVSDETLVSYMAAANAMVVPLADTLSSRARWPSKVNLSLSRGLPVVITRVGDLPRLLEQERAAFVAQPDPTDFAQRIIDSALDLKSVECVKIGAKRVADKVLPWTTIIAGLEDFYSTVLARPPVPWDKWSHPSSTGGSDGEEAVRVHSTAARE